MHEDHADAPGGFDGGDGRSQIAASDSGCYCDRLAQTVALDFGLPFVVFNVGDLIENAGARFGRRAGPGGKSFLRRLHGFLGMVLRAGGDLADHVAGGRAHWYDAEESRQPGRPR